MSFSATVRRAERLSFDIMPQTGTANCVAYTLIKTAKLNRIDPKVWLAKTPARIPDHEINRIDDLLP